MPDSKQRFNKDNSQSATYTILRTDGLLYTERGICICRCASSCRVKSRITPTLLFL